MGIVVNNTMKSRVSELADTIRERLTPLIKSDYLLLDCPFHSNIGDVMIWAGERSFLNSLPYRCIGQSSYVTYRKRMKLSPDVTILLHGGGNFGDVWREHSEFRLEVVERYPDNPIVILPQTVHYDNLELLKSDAERFSRHDNLTICARDSRSYEILKKHFSNSVVMVPDMAFCIDGDRLRGWMNPSTTKPLYIQRRDHELADESLPDSLPKDVEVRDWPTFERRDCNTKLLLALVRSVEIADRSVATRWLANLLAKSADNYAANSYMQHSIKVGVELLSQFDKVYTTRLHASILAILLGIECHMYDNIYGKNSTFFNTWLKGVEGVTLQKESL